MPWADSRIIWTRLQVTTDPVPRRTIRNAPSGAEACAVEAGKWVPQPADPVGPPLDVVGDIDK
jgi:hypothetical protein